MYIAGGKASVYLETGFLSTYCSTLGKQKNAGTKTFRKKRRILFIPKEYKILFLIMNIILSLLYQNLYKKKEKLSGLYT